MTVPSSNDAEPLPSMSMMPSSALSFAGVSGEAGAAPADPTELHLAQLEQKLRKHVVELVSPTVARCKQQQTQIADVFSRLEQQSLDNVATREAAQKAQAECAAIAEFRRDLGKYEDERRRFQVGGAQLKFLSGSGRR